MLGNGDAVAAARVDHADTVTLTAVEIDGIHAGAVPRDDLQPRAGGDDSVAHDGKTGDYSIAVLQILNKRLLVGAAGVLYFVAVDTQPIRAVLGHGLGD